MDIDGVPVRDLKREIDNRLLSHQTSWMPVRVCGAKPGNVPLTSYSPGGSDKNW